MVCYRARMSRRTFGRIIAGLVAAFVVQAAILMTMDRQVRLSSVMTRVYIYEGDLVSIAPPENADKASRTVIRNWLVCRYWNGMVVKTFLVPTADPCPLITP